jgi:hypothetical protein
MSYRVALLASVLVLGVAATAQQPAAPAPAAPAAKPSSPEPPYSIHQIDLEPAGMAFSLDAPRLEGDYWVFTSIPDRQITRVKKERVKKITARSHDLSKEVAWQVELLPSGSLLAKDEPKEKSGGYTFTTWKNGTLTSVRKTEVKSVTKLVGLDAFKAEQKELGSFVLEGEIPENAGQGRVHGGSPAPASGGAPAAGGSAQGQGNWTYQGKPGVTDAYAPPNAVQSRPGDVPKAAPTPK